jgi:hypothetical protein
MYEENFVSCFLYFFPSIKFLPQRCVPEVDTHELIEAWNNQDYDHVRSLVQAVVSDGKLHHLVQIISHESDLFHYCVRTLDTWAEGVEEFVQSTEAAWNVGDKDKVRFKFLVAMEGMQ